jgi:hypothetical protein
MTDQFSKLMSSVVIPELCGGSMKLSRATMRKRPVRSRSRSRMTANSVPIGDVGPPRFYSGESAIG